MDDTGVYFMMEYIKGDELWNLLYSEFDKPPTPLQEPMVQFYAAGLVSILIHLHKQRIVYRDLKPENVMINSTNGYPKLIDFGFAKQIGTRTWTLCGTPYYLSPEILSCIGHDTSCDWWALGILLYEVFFGCTPFQGDSVFNTYTNILSHQFVFPAEPHPSKISTSAIEFITGLLQQEKKQRIGGYVKDEVGGERSVYFHTYIVILAAFNV